MANRVGDLVSGETLRRMAWGRSFGRGQDYFASGCVVRLRESKGSIEATVRGTQEYRVRLWNEAGRLEFECDCPVGRDGAFCKHAVATGLAWLDQQESGKREEAPPKTTIDDVREYLAGKSKEELIELILDCCDDQSHDRLFLEAGMAKSDGSDIGTLRALLDDAVAVSGFVDYHEAHTYVNGINFVVDAIECRLGEKPDEAVLELIEHALAAVEGALGYVDDSGGDLSITAEQLAEMHLAACEKVRPNPVALAKRLFEWEMHSDWSFVACGPEAYQNALGASGLAEYRRIAEEAWGRLSPPVGETSETFEERYARGRLTRIMESLARLSDDIEELVQVKAKDLTSAYSYLDIAGTYQSARQYNQALEWAEKGLAAFPERPDSRLLLFLAKEYFRRRRQDDGMAMVWRHFVDRPSLDSFCELKQWADRAGQWEKWRERALTHVRKAIADSKRQNAKSRSSVWLSRGPDHSLLVEIFLWEKDADAAWREAQEGGCVAYLWLKLAKAREKGHPSDALSVYRERVEPALARKNNEAYREAVGYIRKVHGLMKRCGREAEFAPWLEAIKATHKRKRNFMSLLQRARWK